MDGNRGADRPVRIILVAQRGEPVGSDKIHSFLVHRPLIDAALKAIDNFLQSGREFLYP